MTAQGCGSARRDLGDVARASQFGSPMAAPLFIPGTNIRMPVIPPGAAEAPGYRDVMARDERRHARICRDLARQLGEPDAIPPGIFHEERADLEKVVSMLTVERLFVRGIDQAAAFFGQWGREFAEGFRLIEREERPHIAHGRAVLHRLARDPEVADAARRFRGAAVAGFRTELVAPFAEIVGGHSSGRNTMARSPS